MVEDNVAYAVISDREFTIAGMAGMECSFHFIHVYDECKKNYCTF